MIVGLGFVNGFVVIVGVCCLDWFCLVVVL